MGVPLFSHVCFNMQLMCMSCRLFEDAVSKLNLVALVGFLHQLRKASQSQLFDSVTETGDYSLAMPGTLSTDRMPFSLVSDLLI